MPEGRRPSRHCPSRRGICEKNHPLPPGWSVAFEPQAPTLAPGDEIEVRVAVTPPEAFAGRQPVNVDAFDAIGLAGGVTFYVEKV
ncbi:NEW3 domain-containing protein [Mesorhizobium sp. AaZ16]|uniref:NEW3 domain-containing protein n=1 Tax=Mesorhizobium sp. AaZ16 TaxID=3402289 RepID=UPI00374FA93B